MDASPTIILSGMAVLALCSQWLAWRLRVPSILFLLLVGFAMGPMGGWLEPDKVFGELLFPVISLSVAVILFEGGLTLRFEDIRGLETIVRRLVSGGILVTWAVTALAAHWFLPFTWKTALLFSAITVVTGPTVIVPLLRTVRPAAKVAHILRWEGILIDPIGALLAVLVFEFIVAGAGEAALGHTLVLLAQMLVTGLVLGSAAGFGFGQILRRHWLPEYLHNVAALAIVLGVFALADSIQSESGLLAVTVMGVWLANMNQVPVENILNFKESLSVLLISYLFLVLAARIDPGDFTRLGWESIGVLLIMQFVARPLKVLVSAWNSALSWRERILLAWIAPRGVVAAAVAAVFAIDMQERGYADAGLLVPQTFLVIIGTVLLQSLTARRLALALGVAEPEATGYLVVGANPLALAIAKTLHDRGVQTLVGDSDWRAVRVARLEGIDTYYGDPVSEHADRHLDLVGLGHLLALSPDGQRNALACLRYRSEFGDHAIFALQTANEGSGSRYGPALPRQARILFGKGITLAQLEQWMSEGAEVHATQLTDGFGFEDYRSHHGERAVCLFTFDTKGQVHWFLADHQPAPKSGWTVVALLCPGENPDEQAESA